MFEIRQVNPLIMIPRNYQKQFTVIHIFRAFCVCVRFTQSKPFSIPWLVFFCLYFCCCYFPNYFWEEKKTPLANHSIVNCILLLLHNLKQISMYISLMNQGIPLSPSTISSNHMSLPSQTNTDSTTLNSLANNPNACEANMMHQDQQLCQNIW